MFELREVNARFNGRQVLHAVSLSIAPGERVALVGESGAGKSTLLRLFHERYRADAALVPQELGLVRALSVFHNIYMGRLREHPAWYNLVNLVRPLQREVGPVREVAERLGLVEKLFEPAQELSGGQQQRTAVGRALHQRGRILIGDEPVSSVDVGQGRVVLENINETHETVLLAMHDVDLALAYTTRVVGLRDGRIVLDEPTDGMRPADLGDLYRH